VREREGGRERNRERERIVMVTTIVGEKGVKKKNR
jgi:hypothetical protein